MTLLRRTRRPEIWYAGDVPRRVPHVQLVVGPPCTLVTGSGDVALDDLGVHLWEMVDGARSAPTLARAIADLHGGGRLATALDVHARLEELAAAGALVWV